MTQHQEFAIKQRKNDLKGLEKAHKQESNGEFVTMRLDGVKGLFRVKKSNVELRKTQGYELA